VKVAVLKGGKSLERNVSLRSGARVEDALARLGHGAVPLDAGGSIRITTSRYFTPSGKSVDEKGIEPDLPVPQLSDADRPKADPGRFADLRRQIVREAKVDQAILEADTDTDPRFKTTAEELKKQGVTDFQMTYAVKTLERLGGAPTAATPAAARRR